MSDTVSMSLLNLNAALLRNTDAIGFERPFMVPMNAMETLYSNGFGL
jgi:hypothetical protein